MEILDGHVILDAMNSDRLNRLQTQKRVYFISGVIKLSFYSRVHIERHSLLLSKPWTRVRTREVHFSNVIFVKKYS